jgi:hypothetical protein
VTNPSNGLLPQLVDVLQALAESQQLLTDRIRRAHLELVGGPSSRVEESWQAPPLDRESAAIPLVVTGPIPAGDMREPFARDSSELSIESTGVPSNSASNRGIEVGSITFNDQEMAAPPNTQTKATTSFAEPEANPSATPNQPNDLRTTRRDEPSTKHEDRSYNFFDELDARLAGLGDAAHGTEETGT